ncbi:OmpP1/FadL family transporter [Wenxinia marina]|uniref:Long-chain fatty acid transport protein n=1 Tax=Wenxinia marina DSM 24838 TaxID=1123501 RepID=A0A0D0P7S4_9RHOB|nr:outer membrane protein transport protein [Wenxinia marina]KIQ67626.1 Long-chain fatty acid transport protein [Wenxinia marina DSM 24838]GGL80156.1 membrane protein [Wenxinia marina]
MKHLLSSGAALLLTAGAAGAVGLDRSNQDITVLFEDGNYAELSFGRIVPDVTGSDLSPPFPGYDYDDVGEDYSQFGAAVKMDIGTQMSFAVIFDQPFGADVLYGGSPAATALGGTEARLDSGAITALGRFRINDAFSVHAGVVRERLDAEITLSGLAYGTPFDPTAPAPTLNGYNVQLEESDAWGYVVGAAYERPDIALRLAVTYHSSMEHEFETTETLGGVPVNVLNPALSATSTTTVNTPEAINIDFQTGIAQDTLLFANVRYAKYEDVIVSPVFFDTAQDGGLRDMDSLTEIESNTSYSVGVGRRFSDAFSASVAVGYEGEGSDDLVSPLSPTNGNYSLQLGAAYTVGDIVLSGGVRYTWLGDAMPETGTPDEARAEFTDNDALSAGLTVGFRF